MSTITHSCPHCKHVIVLPATLAGQQGKCPKCNAVVMITAAAQQQPVYQQPVQQQPVYQQPAPPNVNPLLEPEGCPYPGRLIKIVLDSIENLVTDSQLSTLSDRTGNLAGWCIIGTGLALVLFVGGISIQTEEFEPLIGIPIGLALITLLQFVNHHSLRGIRSMLKEEFPMSGKTYLRIVGSIWLFATVAMPFLILWLIAQGADQYEPYVTVAVLFVLCGFMTLITTRPMFLGIKFDQSANIVDDTLAVAIYNFKALAALTPYLYFVGVNLLTAILFIQGTNFLFSDGYGYLSESEILPAVYLIMLPLGIYITALGSLTFTYVIKAILDIPRILDDQ